ncbi:HSP20-like chaperone [Sesbania bispinosa]|nr:HSP20-like chaperone [Sesbania bispinosa]
MSQNHIGHHHPKFHITAQVGIRMFKQGKQPNHLDHQENTENTALLQYQFLALLRFILVVSSYSMASARGIQEARGEASGDSHGRIVVKGERQANEQKRVRFQLTFPAPVDSDMEKIAGNFDGGILYVTVPKRIAEENRESETEQAGNGHVERAEENDSHEPNAANEGRDPTCQPYRATN